LCREEARELSSLSDEFKKLDFNLVGVVHETLGTDEFHEKFFTGHDLYLDQERSFYNLLGNRWLGVTGFLRPSVWQNINRAKAKNVEGNMEGEGRLLGGLLVIGPGDTGVLFEHREEVWGDHADREKVLEACKSLKSFL